MEKNYYEILGLKETATLQEIGLARSRYRIIAFQNLHLSLSGSDRRYSFNETLISIYNILADPIRRNKYDAALRRKRRFYKLKTIFHKLKVPDFFGRHPFLALLILHILLVGANIFSGGSHASNSNYYNSRDHISLTGSSQSSEIKQFSDKQILKEVIML